MRFRALKLITSKRGQQTVEFLLMLGVIVSAVLVFISAFHLQLAGAFFSVIGRVLG
ncbi:MAG: hypothetical protein LBG46_05665 [Elusimicrobiota bacterium]|jgi:uncharacterized protein (UPF0333 family)|nr:hypothetical protein [Elusimicrobiota bacterium]